MSAIRNTGAALTAEVAEGPGWHVTRSAEKTGDCLRSALRIGLFILVLNCTLLMVAAACVYLGRLNVRENSPDVAMDLNCAAVCWQEIRLGQTTLDEATARLAANRWVRVESDMIGTEKCWTLTARLGWVCLRALKVGEPIWKLGFVFWPGSYRLGDAIRALGEPLGASACWVAGLPPAGSEHLKSLQPFQAVYVYFRNGFVVVVDLARVNDKVPLEAGLPVLYLSLYSDWGVDASTIGGWHGLQAVAAECS